MLPRLHIAELATRRVNLSGHLVGVGVGVGVRVRVRVRIRVRVDLSGHPVASDEERVGPL